MQLFLRLMKKVYLSWLTRTRAAWRRERGIWRRTKRKPSDRQLTGAVMLIVYVPTLWWVSVNTSLLMMLSFTFASFLAISYATFFFRPFIFLGIFIGIIVGGVANEILKDSGSTALEGDLVGAAVLVGVGIYVHWWARQYKSGDAFEESQTELRSSKRRSRKGNW